MNHIKDIDIKNKRILIRFDYNVPILDGKIVDGFRVDSSFETIDYCLKNNCKLVLISHLGRPKSNQTKFSLYPVFEYLKQHYANKVYFSNNCVSNDALEKSKRLKGGEILLLENLRFHKEELECEKRFSEKLSLYGDIYINDAFGTAHRSHASNVGVCEYFKDKAYGFLIQKEKKYLLDGINKNSNQLTLMLGGSKISDKIKLLERFLNIADNILIGGAMSNNFLKAKGYEIGKSLYQPEYVDFAKNILNSDSKSNIFTPLDYICVKDINSVDGIRNAKYSEIQKDELSVDIGCNTVDLFKRIIFEDSKSIIWNGPMGVIETSEFSKGTKSMIEAIKNINNEKFISIIGGGDTSSMIEKNEYNNFSHISTGGGASLKLLSGQKMPSFEALK